MADKITKNFDVPLLDIDGNPNEEMGFDKGGRQILNEDGSPKMMLTPNLNILVSRALWNIALKDGDPYCDYQDWAHAFKAGGEIELSRDAYNKIKLVIERYYQSVPVRAQISKLLDA